MNETLADTLGSYLQTVRDTTLREAERPGEAKRRAIRAYRGGMAAPSIFGATCRPILSDTVPQIIRGPIR